MFLGFSGFYLLLRYSDSQFRCTVHSQDTSTRHRGPAQAYTSSENSPSSFFIFQSHPVVFGGFSFFVLLFDFKRSLVNMSYCKTCFCGGYSCGLELVSWGKEASTSPRLRYTARPSRPDWFGPALSYSQYKPPLAHDLWTSHCSTNFKRHMPDAMLGSRETKVPAMCSVPVKEISVQGWTKWSIFSYSLHPLARGDQTPVSILTWGPMPTWCHV